MCLYSIATEYNGLFYEAPAPTENYTLALLDAVPVGKPTLDLSN